MIKKVFSQVVLLMVESGHVDLQSVYLDGTKIESVANRYTFVWGKRINTSKDRIAQQLEELWKYTQGVAAEELKDIAPTSFEEVNPEKVRQTVEQINQALKDKEVDKKVKQKLNYAKKHWADKLEQYDKEQAILGDRGSYSKTDQDATFMPMKEDHMKNRQLKSGYNTQISTNNQIITHYSIHQNPTDTTTLKSHLDSFKQIYSCMPKEITADAGYGSEENYEYLENNHIDGFVKYTHFDREQRTGKQEQDCHICPMGQPMKCLYNKEEQTKTGYQKIISYYQATN